MRISRCKAVEFPLPKSLRMSGRRGRGDGGAGGGVTCERFFVYKSGGW